jgi:hypothetical protein
MDETVFDNSESEIRLYIFPMRESESKAVQEIDSVNKKALKLGICLIISTLVLVWSIVSVKMLLGFASHIAVWPR